MTARRWRWRLARTTTENSFAGAGTLSGSDQKSLPEIPPHPPRDAEAERAGAWLAIDLDAIAWNYRRLGEELGETVCSAVVKADGYGLGIRPVGRALARAGARWFFVAQIGEGIVLREALADWPEARIAVLNGLQAGCEDDFREFGLTPVLNSLGEIDLWREQSRREELSLPAILHVDTGMNRLGMPADELERLAENQDRLDGIDLTAVMSHLIASEQPAAEENPRQLARFRDVLRLLPASPASLANSSGIFLGPEYHFDMARPGVALYGVNPTPGHANPMRPVVSLKGRILQVRAIDAPETVGYGATHRVVAPARIATVAVGYGDGFLRSLSNRGHADLAGVRIPIVGRVSMDLITLDVTAVPDGMAQPGTMVDLIGPHYGVDDLAADAGTIGYEILTALGRRHHRRYIGG